MTRRVQGSPMAATSMTIFVPGARSRAFNGREGVRHSRDQQQATRWRLLPEKVAVVLGPTGGGCPPLAASRGAIVAWASSICASPTGRSWPRLMGDAVATSWARPPRSSPGDVPWSVRRGLLDCGWLHRFRVALEWPPVAGQRCLLRMSLHPVHIPQALRRGSGSRVGASCSLLSQEQ